MTRLQFSLKTLLWLMLVVGAFFGGMQLEWHLLARRGVHRRVIHKDDPNDEYWAPLDYELDPEYREVGPE